MTTGKTQFSSTIFLVNLVAPPMVTQCGLMGINGVTSVRSGSLLKVVL